MRVFSTVFLRAARSVRFLAAILCAGMLVSPVALAQPASPLPAPTGHVNDYVGVIDSATQSRLETKLRDYRDRSGVEIAVAVISTTDGRDIFDYSLAVARGWGIGASGDYDPAALLLVAIDDRKYFTQVSRDLEPELPDGIVGSLQRQHLVPEFRKGNYAKGIEDTINAYIDTIERRRSGEDVRPAEPPAAGRQVGTDGAWRLFCCFSILLVIFLIIYASVRGGGGKSNDDQDRWGGGSGGSDIGSVLPWLILGGLSSSGSSSGSSSSWGGWDSGSSWGGFGGGGDFGGGGAGGGW